MFIDDIIITPPFTGFINAGLIFGNIKTMSIPMSVKQ